MSVADDRRRRKLGFWAISSTALVALIAICIAALCMGPVKLSVSTILQTLITPYNAANATPISTIVWQVRLPRILLATVVGAALAGAGAAFQALMRNDLAEPYVLGISSGASAAAAFISFAPASIPLLQLIEPLGAFVGAVAVLFLVISISYSYGQIDTRSLLLTGVIVSAFLWAVEMTAFKVAGKSDEEILNYLMGSLSGANWNGVSLLVIVVAIAYLVLIFISPSMNLYSLGEESAKQLGLDAERFKWLLIVTATALTAATVALVGIIGFIGLIAPHIARKMLRTPDNRKVLPLSALVGAILMVCSDTAARLLLSGDVLPVGIVTAFLGAPFFCYKLKFR